MYNPGATYRIQFHKDFTFDDLEKIIPYLHQLGIRTIYASPVFAAMPGSTHGYDGIDPDTINPEIGSLDQLRRIAGRLKSLGMGWVQDFVPNHMAYAPDNPWICDFMEKGKMSAYDHFFDKNPDEPLMAPFLGATADELLQQQALSIVYRNERFQLAYGDACYPLNYSAYNDILNHELLDHTVVATLRAQMVHLSEITNPGEFQPAWEAVRHNLSQHYAKDPAILEAVLDKISKDASFLKSLMDMQFYRLCYWKETHTKINYRRFFTINGLISLNMQYDEVFDAYHQLLSELVREEVIQGVRIDHVDGLYDPAAYLQRLRSLVGPEVYIVVEKILERGERLPAHWPVQGTTGYEFLAQVNSVLTDTAAQTAFEEHYGQIDPAALAPGEQTYVSKQLILERYMAGEWHNLRRQFVAVAGKYLPQQVSEDQLQQVIAELLICCPVYRYYPDTLPLRPEQLKNYEALVMLVRQRGKADPDALDFFIDCNARPDWLSDQTFVDGMLHFWRRFMQVSGPLMAKGVEDTQMYNDQRMLAHNEVGDSLSSFGMSATAFHELMIERQRDYPLSMNATATHDTKRGEDSRARLQLLTATHRQWLDGGKTWLAANGTHAGSLSPADQYFVLQTVYAALDESDAGEFEGRLAAYLTKAAREAKSRSDWDQPDLAYEQELIDFGKQLASTLNVAGQDIRKYLDAMQDDALAQSIAQLTLKCTCPGVPDIYQGTEFRDLSFVDPDNRRPVDYNKRQDALLHLEQHDTDAATSFSDRFNNTKLFCLQRLLDLRKELPDLFSKGCYEPVDLGEDHLAFSRRYKNDCVLVIVPLQKASQAKASAEWLLPAHFPAQWKNVLTGRQLHAANLDIADQLDQFPVLVLHGQFSTSQRKAGVLLPLFSLPSRYGIGDMGSEARAFITNLFEGGQRLWQILPLNPVLEANACSPYACSSAFAGDPMYIDLEALRDEGLLETFDLLSIEVPATRKVNYATVRANKDALLDKAWASFQTRDDTEGKAAFTRFCAAEAHWLEDYAAYIVLKQVHADQPWTEWPEGLRHRRPEALAEFKAQERAGLDQQRWLQFVFFQQWDKLKAFARANNISFVGDIPFYMSQDSADVWAKPELFAMNEDSSLQWVAGVPPDYFSATGQLWGMPTYRWPVHQQQGYRWWLDRLQQNVRLFDIVRLDHFRAFYDYWEIPGNAETAIEGSWQAGPRDDLFTHIKDHFPEMPFIAEDLGEIHRGVFAFKDTWKLPGMRVLQFGFSTYDPSLRDLPHNCTVSSVVYTGTHDNNTTAGWFAELDDAARNALQAYAGTVITEDNVADVMIKMAYGTVAETLIIPIQDLLSLGSGHRMNTPSTTDGNWQWRMLPDECTGEQVMRLLMYARRYNR